ncbi:uncharacterized protein LTR77_006301 [Saxophila tyrrhenica]|uniref:Sugar phosphate transporter domain-containing protein n=1 Tax=Saxophila tyrrhenica TaxID=1690608 RepID=A0AAV9PBF4_9PEZI|nr:hypothetical protein LTR77_006301 [Saxophila tyrrhenica]
MENEKERISDEQPRDGPQEPMLPTVNPAVSAITEKPEPAKGSIHPAFYIADCIAILLTSWHLGFATLMTQLLSRTTTLLDSRKRVPMTGRVYLRTILPIGLMFSLSLICGNLTYLYLSVSFIQMLKATMPVVTLLTSWAMAVEPVSLKKLGNVSFIVLGVVVASYGEIQFVLIGFLYQCGGIVFEAMRLVMVQRLLSGAEFKMDPLVSLYYFAPVCALMNGVIALVVEVPRMTFVEVQNVGFSVLILNAVIAFLLNVSVVFLIGKTSSLVMTLSGVLKDILLVCASMLIFRDPVSGLQAFGYSIALFGLVYYKLGAESLKEYISAGLRSWADFGQRRPVARRLTSLAFGVVVVIMMLAVVSGTGAVPERYDPGRVVHGWLWKALGSFGKTGQ